MCYIQNNNYLKKTDFLAILCLNTHKKMYKIMKIAFYDIKNIK